MSNPIVPIPNLSKLKFAELLAAATLIGLALAIVHDWIFFQKLSQEFAWLISPQDYFIAAFYWIAPTIIIVVGGMILPPIVTPIAIAVDTWHPLKVMTSALLLLIISALLLYSGNINAIDNIWACVGATIVVALAISLVAHVIARAYPIHVYM